MPLTQPWQITGFVLEAEWQATYRFLTEIAWQTPCMQCCRVCAHLEVLQEGQQGMTRVYGLEAAQQVGAVCLLTQIQGNKLCPYLSNTCLLSTYLTSGNAGQQTA